jgi:hypothetical protein
LGFAEINEAPGSYELDPDGVPVLGFVTERLNRDRVKFTMCDTKRIEVSFNPLTTSKTECSDSGKKPDIWRAGTKIDL